VAGDAWGGSRLQKTVRNVLLVYGSTCHLCGQDGADSADHLIPRSKGGPLWDLANLRPSHLGCNVSRGAMDLDEWRRRHPIDDRPALQPSRKWI
jgi:5-methylcytosine-specific restriction endonuclease McrA